jgi:hypothetical protein
MTIPLVSAAAFSLIAGILSSSNRPPQEVDVRRRYLFAKIERRRNRCTELLPGTMVRVDRYYAQRIRGIHRDAMGISYGRTAPWAELSPGAMD